MRASKSLGDEVLEALGFVDGLRPDGIVEDLVEEGLEQPVVADDLEGAPAFLPAGQALTPRWRLVDRRDGGSAAASFLQHVGDGGHGDVQAVSQTPCCRYAGFRRLSEGKDGLEVIIDGLGVGFRRAAPDHIFLFSTRD